MALPITLKRYNGATWDELNPKTTQAQVDGLVVALGNKIETSLIGANGGLATLDGGGHVPETQLPSSVFGGMRLIGAIGAPVAMSALETAMDAYISSNGGSAMGSYWIATTTLTVSEDGVGLGWTANVGEETDHVGDITIEKGDWIIVTEVQGTLDLGFSILNNTYPNATTSAYGITRLSNATLFASLSGNDVVTEGILKTVIDNANFATAGHNHDATYLGINANAVSASKLATARTISLSGDVSGSVSFDGSGNVTMSNTVVANNSHNHLTSNVDNYNGSALNVPGATLNAILENLDSEVRTNFDDIDDLEANIEVFYDAGTPVGFKTGDIWIDA